MEYDKEKGEITLEREASKLDKFVLDFTKLLDKYVIVSGYVSILFGRARATEDIDLLVPGLDEREFGILWHKTSQNGFECLNTSNAKEAFTMLKKHAIRFARKGDAIPNIEFKVIKNEVDRYSFENRIRVIIGGAVLYISQLEMQIAYKRYYLKSGKDMEDALHIEEVFKGKIDRKKIDKAKLLLSQLK